MSLRSVINSVSTDFHKKPIVCLVTELANGIKNATNENHVCIWLAEQEDEGCYFFYTPLAGFDESIDGEQVNFTESIEIDERNFTEALQAATNKHNSQFIPIIGTRFGQKSEKEYLKPVEKLVGALELPEGFEKDGIYELAELSAAYIWNHRSSRFLLIENEIDQILENSKKKSLGWTSVIPGILDLTHSNKFAVFERMRGTVVGHSECKETYLGTDFYQQKIEENEVALDAGRWLRSICPESLSKGKSVFWMLVPLSTAHYRHLSSKIEICDKVRHYVVLETVTNSSSVGRSLYSSTDRRLVEHSLSKYLDGIAEWRIDEVTKEISEQLPVDLPGDPSEAVEDYLNYICDRVYDVCDACVVSPAIALQSEDVNEQPSEHEGAIISTGSIELDRNALSALMRFDQGKGSYLNSKHVEVASFGKQSGLVFSVGGNQFTRFLILIFNDKFSSYVTTEICSRVAARLQIFLQSCELQNERTASLTQIAHVLRGPVSSALEEIQAILRDRRTPTIHKIQYEGAMGEDDKLSMVANRLARARSITDSAKHLVGQISPRSFQRRRVDIISILVEVRSSLEVERKQKNMRINIKDQINRLESEQAYIWGDEDLLWLFAYNLFENAIKYGRRESEISVLLTSIKQETIGFSIENTGDLIWSFDKKRIFIPYQRALSSLPMNGKEGTGIGLPAANEIVRAFNPKNHKGIRLTQSAQRSDKTITGKVKFSADFVRAN